MSSLLLLLLLLLLWLPLILLLMLFLLLLLLFVVDVDVCADLAVFYVVVKLVAGAFSLQLLFGGRRGI